MKKRKIIKAKSSGISSFLFGVLLNAAVYAALVLISSIVAYLSENPTGFIRVFSLAALLMSGMICGFIIGKRSNWAYTALLSAATFSIIVILLGVILSGGAPSVGNIVNYLIFIVISAVFSKFSSRFGRSKFRH